MREDIGSVPMADPLACFLTWATYKTWLPGDERGWVAYSKGRQPPNLGKKATSALKMTEEPCLLDSQQRSLVESQVAETCRHKGWTLLAVNCRSTHLHVVLHALVAPDTVRDQLKAWCTRRLKELEKTRLETPTRGVSQDELEEKPENTTPAPGAVHRSGSELANTGARRRIVREKWWAERGSARCINSQKDLEAAIVYVRECQD